jgi:hypothetical protein
VAQGQDLNDRRQPSDKGANEVDHGAISGRLDLSVPINLRPTHGDLPTDDEVARYRSLVADQLARLQAEGWIPDEPPHPTDFLDAKQRGRLKKVTLRGIIFGWPVLTAYQELTLTVKRATTPLTLTWTNSVPWFDALREVNAQAGRLATVTGLSWAAFSFSIQQDPLHSLLRPKLLQALVALKVAPDDFWPTDAPHIVSLLVSMVIVSLGVAVFSTLASLGYAIPVGEQHRQQCTRLVRDKSLYCLMTLVSVGGAFIVYMFAWLVAINATDESTIVLGKYIVVISPFIYILTLVYLLRDRNRLFPEIHGRRGKTKTWVFWRKSTD